MSSDLASAIRDELARLLAPLSAARSGPGVVHLLLSVGRTDALASHPGFAAEIARLAGLSEALARLGDEDLVSWAGLEQVLRLSRDIFTAVRAIDALVSDPALADQVRDFGRDLAEQLTALYARGYHARLFRAASLLTLVTPAEEGEPWRFAAGNGRVTRLPVLRDRIHVDRAGALVRDALATLQAAYFPNELARAGDAHEAARRVFPLLRALAATFDLPALTSLAALNPPPPDPGSVDQDDIDADHFDDVETDEEEPDTPGESQPPVDLTSFHRDYVPRFVVALPALPASPGAPTDARIGLSIVCSSAEHDSGTRGLIVSPVGRFNWTETRGTWRLALSADGEIPAVVIGPRGLTLAPTPSPGAGAKARLQIERIAEDGAPAWNLGSATGTRLELGNVRFGLDCTLTPSRRAVALTIDVDQAKLVIAPGDGDGFLRAILPPEGVRVVCSVGLTMSSDRGLDIGVTVEGGSLSGSTPVGRSIGPVRIEALTRDFRLVETGRGSGLTAAIGVRLSLRLGPVALTLDGPSVGADLLWSLKPPAQAPNLGVVHFDGLGLRAPTSAGLEVDGALVQGAGSLQYDSARHQYAGSLELLVRDRLALRVAGVLTTRMPDGRDGYSLLLLGSLGFPPIPVGFGFSLDELGAFVGINRTTDVDALTGALGAGTLEAALFPGNPTAMASLPDSLDKLFPAKQDVHTVGVLAGFSWGRASLARIELGFFYDTSAPHRIVAVGRLVVERPRIVLHVLALGVLDFDIGELDLQAHLGDSRILGADVSGDAAVMLRWGADPSFVLSIGGFHPAFQPPTEFTRRFPALRRVTIRAHTDESVLRLALQAYVAVTSSTVQMGARVDFGVTVSAFSVDGMVSFDALIQIDPRLHIDVMVRGSVAVKAVGVTLFGARVAAQLVGPGDWYAEGTATISLLWFDIDFGFTVGDKTDAPALPTVEGATLLAAALGDARSWSAELAASGAGLVAVRRPTAPGGPLLFHPLDELTVRQQVVPLGVVVDRVEAGRLAASRTFEATVTVGGATATTEPAWDAFARAKYVEMSDAARLSAPSFEPMPSGVHVILDSAAAPAPSVTTLWNFDEFVWTIQGLRSPTVRAFVPDAIAVAHALATSATASAPLRRAGGARYRAPLDRRVTLPRGGRL